MLNLEFVTASINPQVLNNNLLPSYAFAAEGYGLTVQRNFTNIPEAYNSAKTRSEMVCYVHDDVHLPIRFIWDFAMCLSVLPDDWEVLGVAGVTGPPKVNHGYIDDRGKFWGELTEKPVKVDTLDELLLITRGDIKFDPQFSQDFYGADICIGRQCYVVPCFVHHNSSRAFGGRTEKFYEAERLFKNKHLNHLPIQTTCSLVTL